MYKNVFDGLLANQNLPKSILLYGQCSFSSDYYRHKTIEVWKKKDAEVLSMHFGEYNYNEAKTYLASSSLFGGGNILHVKSEKSIPKKELDVLVELCAKNAGNYFVLQFGGDDKKGANMAKAFNKKMGADFVRFFEIKLGEAMNYLQKRAKELNLHVDNFALKYLYEMHSNDLSLAYNELEKLTLIDGEITSKAIEQSVFGLGSVGLDEFVQMVFDKKDFRGEFDNLTQIAGYSEVKIINKMQDHINQLLMFSLYIRSHGRYDVMEILGYKMPDFVAKQKAQMAHKYNLQTYKNILQILCYAELKLKTDSKIDKKSFLLSTLIKIQSYL